MNKLLTLALIGALALGLTSPTHATFCAVDAAPAASLLFPFVAFDYNNPVNGMTTLFAITNAASEAQVVHITLWTDTSVPILDYNIVLSGYDVVTQNIRDILYFGDLPNTGTARGLLVRGDQPLADGPVNEIAYPYPYLDPPEGTNALANASRRCRSSDPFYPDYPGIDQATLSQLRSLLQVSQTSAREHYDCAGSAVQLWADDWFLARDGIDVTWLYITADVVWTCNRGFPDRGSYWEFNCADPTYNDLVAAGSTLTCQPDGDKRVENVLMGDVFWINDALDFSAASHAIHLEANPFNDTLVTATPDNQPISFFYRYSTSLGVQNDMREPLPTGWGFRYLGWKSDAFDTYIRAFKQASHVPAQHPGDQNRVVDLHYVESTGALVAYDCVPYSYFAWDEDENVAFFPGGGWWNPDPVILNLLPLATQEVEIDWFNFPDHNGWVVFLWPASNWFDPVDAWTGDPVNGNGGIDWYQTWMGVAYAAYGTHSAAMDAAVMANFNCFADEVYPDFGRGNW